MSDISVLLPDGSSRQVPVGATVGDLAASIGSRLAKAAVAGTINGAEVDLSTPLVDGQTVAIITHDSEAGRHVLRHSTAHVLAQAVVQLFPGAQFSIGPAIEDGFYYDFDHPEPFSEADLKAIKKEMVRIIGQQLPLEQLLGLRQGPLPHRRPQHRWWQAG